MKALREKSEKLTGFMEFLINEANQNGYNFNIITPKNPKDRGCQLSIITDETGKELFNYLTDNGVIADWREDNLFGKNGGVIRVAAVPLYNSFEDVFNFVQMLKKEA